MDILENLNKVSKAISTKNLIPSLSGIKFDLTKEGLTLTASNNDLTIQKFIEIKDENMNVQEEGIIIIQGKEILDIVRVIPEEEININEIYPYVISYVRGKSKCSSCKDKEE